MKCYSVSSADAALGASVGLCQGLQAVDQAANEAVLVNWSLLVWKGESFIDSDVADEADFLEWGAFLSVEFALLDKESATEDHFGIFGDHEHFEVWASGGEGGLELPLEI